MIGKGLLPYLKQKIDDIKSLIGSLTDLVPVPYTATATVLGYLRMGYYHTHGASFILPDEDPVTVTSNTGVWGAITQDKIVEILGVDEINFDYDIHWTSVSDISTTLQGMLYFYTRESDEDDWVQLRAACDVIRTTAQSREIQAPAMISPIKAKTALGIGFKDSTSGSTNCKVKVYGHVYHPTLNGV